MKKTAIAALILVPATLLTGCVTETAYYPNSTYTTGYNYSNIGYYPNYGYYGLGNYSTIGWGGVGLWGSSYNRGWHNGYRGWGGGAWHSGYNRGWGGGAWHGGYNRGWGGGAAWHGGGGHHR